MIRVAICDTHAEFCEKVKRLLFKRFGGEISVTAYNSVRGLETGFEETPEVERADVLLTDVDMEGACAIEAVRRIQERFPMIKVIFISSERERVTDVFRAAPSAFLLKPVEPAALESAVEKVKKQLEEEDQDYFVVTFKGKIFKIRTKDILYFESEKRTVILHGMQENWKIYRKLDDIQKVVPGYFLRCHQSYLVNMNEIKEIRPFRIEMNQGVQLPVSRPKYGETRSCFRRYTGKTGKPGSEIEKEMI